MAKILLVEPDRILAENYRKAFEMAGHKVSVAASAQSAIMAADVMCPDLVVLEFQLARHGGAEFLYEFRSYADWRDVPVIVHTHVSPIQLGEQFRQLRKQLGIIAYLHKPITNLQTLLRSVETATVAL